MKRKYSSSLTHRLLHGGKRRSPGLISSVSETVDPNTSFVLPAKRFFSRQISESKILSKICGLFDGIKHLPVKTLGTVIFSYGICLSVAYLVSNAADGIASFDVTYLISGIISAVAGAIFSSSQQTCISSVKNSRLCGCLLYRVLGFDGNPKPDDSAAVTLNGNIAVLAGVVPGVIALFTTPLLLPVGLPLLLLLYSVFSSPEAGVIITVLAFPFVGTEWLKRIILTATAAWLLKLIRGKRIFAHNTLDNSVLCFAALIFLGSGISLTPEKSFAYASEVLLLMSGYFICVNLIRTRRWLEKITASAVISLSVTTFSYTVNHLLNAFLPGGTAEKIISSLPPFSTVGAMPDTSVTMIIVLLLPLLMMYFILSRSTDSKIGFIILIAISAASAVFVGSVAGVCAVIIGIILAIVLFGRKNYGKTVITAALAGAAILLMPFSFTGKVSSFFSVPERAYNVIKHVFSDTAVIIKNCYPGGIGVGNEAFEAAYPIFAPFSAEIPPHTYNLYLQIAVSVGITGLILFVLTILIYVRHYFSYKDEASVDKPFIRYTAAAGFSGIAALLAYGMFEYVWYDRRILALFWIVLGLSSAAIRTGVRERIVNLLDGPYIDINIGEE